MSYATVDNVKSMFRVLASGSVPAVTDAEIQEFLDDAFLIINAKLGTLYTLPITLGTNPQSFGIVKRIEIFKAADVVDNILNSYGEADTSPEWGKKAKEILMALVPPINPRTCKQCEPTMILPDVPYLGTNQQRGKLKLRSTDTPTFSKGGDNW